jgi:hypothetical protein
MLDDDLSYLESVAQEVRGYGFTILYAGTHAFIATRNVGSEQLVGIVRKVKNLPFYQAYMIIKEPSIVDWVDLVENHRHLHWVMENRLIIKDFHFVDVSGHENFSKNAIAQLKEQFG